MNRPERSQTEILAENLSDIMHRKSISQNALARKLDVSPTVVNKWCRGISMPRPDSIDNICRVLNITRSDLLTDKTAIPNLSIPAAYPVPVIGRICAGNGILAEESFDGYFFVDNSIRATTASKRISESINEKWAPKWHQSKGKSQQFAETTGSQDGADERIRT